MFETIVGKPLPRRRILIDTHDRLRKLFFRVGYQRVGLVLKIHARCSDIRGHYRESKRERVAEFSFNSRAKSQRRDEYSTTREKWFDVWDVAVKLNSDRAIFFELARRVTPDNMQLYRRQLCA